MSRYPKSIFGRVGRHKGDPFGMPYGEIAEKLEITPQRVQQLEQKALKKLRDAGVLDEWRDYLLHVYATR